MEYADRWTERETETVLYDKQFDKLLHDVSYGGTHSANSWPFGDWGAEEKGMEQGKRRLVRSEFGHNPAICLGEEAICAIVYRQTVGRTDAHAACTMNGIAHSV